MRGDNMECHRCLETDTTMFYRGHCRRCIALPFQETRSGFVYKQDAAAFPVTLTPHQQHVSDALCKAVIYGSVFVDAVCGAGKTEVCLELILDYLAKGLKVGWTVPRREVVLELQARLQNYFPAIKVVPVCQGFTTDLAGDLIVCTTHQLYRYYDTFDLLIVDEPDAFPYVGNVVLENLVKTACRGIHVFLSATYSMDDVQTIQLPLRPSNTLLPVPNVMCAHLIGWRLWWDVWKVRKECVLVFVPTQALARKISQLWRVPYMTSECEEKQSILKAFRDKKGILVTTTVLERGVTFLDCFVFVYRADHRVFTEASLVQIAGRAMRGMHPTKGTVNFYCQEKTDAITKCCERIKKANYDAQVVLNL
ncbi:DNA-binding protein [Erysipelothrix sp. HDW6C]|uniref:helicase-related protein n=1 Tax=Erysipelothrix sp. HDW6C TaxID=2714930 RepID=UPI00140B9F35|nr:helicase-related protein [Erysipelothrix sp. HDW6C]QIK68890.1 DNA-binding protein [Erysipelothrix sp. HDW6C]